MATAAPTTAMWDGAVESYPSLMRALAQRLAMPERTGVREGTTITERLLQCIWYDGHFHSENLHLADGRAVEIKSPGRWNSEAGPDFRNAELVIDGARVKGDVELHLRASGWRGHGHASDPNYRGVVLHVVLDVDDGEKGDATPTGGVIPRLELRPLLHGDLESLGQVISVDDFPFESQAMVGRCHRLLSQLDHDPQVTAFFEAAAGRRLRAKMERLETQLGAADFEQVFHQALLTAMGHRGSKTLFFLLSKRVPIAELRALIKRWPEAQRPLAAQAVLLHVANLIRPQQHADPSWDEETMRHVDALHRVWAEVGGHFADRLIPPSSKWHQGMRPANFPSRRIAGLTHLAVGDLAGGEGLFAGLMRRCGDYAANGAHGSDVKVLKEQREELEALLAVDAPFDYWARRHTVGGKALAKPMRLIGEGRARSVLFNALLPLTLLWAKRMKDQRLRAWAVASVQAFPALEENTVTRFMKYRLFATPDPPKSLFKNEVRQQALFHIFTDCCDSVTTSCDQCAFFSRLSKSS